MTQPTLTERLAALEAERLAPSPPPPPDACAHGPTAQFLRHTAPAPDTEAVPDSPASNLRDRTSTPS